MPAGKSFKATAIIVGLIALGAGIGVYSARYYLPPPPVAVEGLMWPNPKQIGPFAAVDQDGRPIALEQLLGKWSFLFFGFTHCPDVCPITLAVLGELERKLAEEKAGAPAQMVFVTVDPQRDTIERLHDYVRHFSAGMIGIGGTEVQIQSLTAQMGVAFMLGAPDAQGSYLVDHSASVFLVDPKGRLLSIFPAPQNADAMFSRFRQIRDFVARVDA